MNKILAVAALAIVLALVPAKVQSPVTMQAQSIAAAQVAQQNTSAESVPVIALQSPVVVQDALADWYINGQWQPNIPFWFTLEEAVAAYFGLM